MLAELSTRFPFGVVLVTDSRSTEEIPQWESDSAQVTSARTALVLRIRHEVDGDSAVRVWSKEPEKALPFDYGTTILEVPSRTLRVCTADGARSVVIEGISARVGVKVTASRNGNPDLVDLVLTPT